MDIAYNTGNVSSLLKKKKMDNPSIPFVPFESDDHDVIVNRSGELVLLELSLVTAAGY